MTTPNVSLSGTGVGVLAGLIALAIVGVYVAKKGVAGVAADVVNAVGDAAAGTVVGIGQAVGIPATDEDKCAAALREGRNWDASFDCKASTFVGSMWAKLTGSEGSTASSTPDGNLADTIGGP